jgi:hypothetical protein
MNMKTKETKTLVALFGHPDAEHAVRDLLAHGITEDRISVLSPAEDPGTLRRRLLQLDEPAHTDRSKATATESVGTTVGIGGVLLGAAFLALPAVGPVLAAGPLLAGMAGAGAGTSSEDLQQRLGKAGVPPGDAERYVQAVARGHALMVLTVAEPDVDDVASILVRHSPIPG